MIKLETDKTGKLTRKSEHMLTECLWAAIRKFFASLPKEIIPGQWELSGDAFRNALLYERTGEPCGVTATVPYPGGDGFEVASVSFDRPGEDTLVWKPSPIDDFMINQAFEETEQQQQDPDPEDDETDSFVDEFIESLLGSDFQSLVMHGSKVLETEAMTRSLAFNLHTLLGTSALQAMDKACVTQVTFQYDGDTWTLEVLDVPSDLGFIPEGGRDLWLTRKGDKERTDFFLAPTDVMFEACVAAVNLNSKEQ